MPGPTPSDVHVNTPLTNMSVAYMQSAANFVADKVFPTLPVMKQSDRYYIYDRGSMNRDEMRKRAPGTKAPRGTYDLDNTPTYYCDEWAYGHAIPDQVRANADSVLSPDRDAAFIVSNKALIRREGLFAANYMVGGVWTGGDVDGVSSGENNTTTFRQWNDAASTPIENIRAAKTSVLQGTGFEPNTLVMGQQVFDKLIDHPDIVDRVKYGQTGPGPATVGIPELAALFGVPRIFVQKAVSNTAAEGASEVSAFIGGKKALLCYAAPQPGIMTPTAGYTFSWGGMFGADQSGVRIRKYREESEKSDIVEIEFYFDLKRVGADLGFFWDTIVS